MTTTKETAEQVALKGLVEIIEQAQADLVVPIDQYVESHGTVWNLMFSDRTRELIQLARAALETAQTSVSFPAGPDRAWLIESGFGVASYLTPHMGWCDNPHHARRFATYKEGREHADSLANGSAYKVREHMWIDPPQAIPAEQAATHI